MFEAKGLITPVLTALDENEKFNPIERFYKYAN